MREAIQAAVKAIDAPDDPKRYAMLATMLISIKALDQAGELLAKARQLFQRIWNCNTRWLVCVCSSGLCGCSFMVCQG